MHMIILNRGKGCSYKVMNKLIDAVKEDENIIGNHRIAGSIRKDD